MSLIRRPEPTTFQMLVSALTTPTTNTNSNVLQLAADHAVTGVTATALTEMFICWLHCNGYPQLANNAYFQIFILLAIEAASKPIQRAIYSPPALLGQAENHPDSDQLEMIYDKELKHVPPMNGFSAVFLSDILGYVAGAICIAICNDTHKHDSDNDMRHVQPMHVAVALCVALGIRFFVFDLGLGARFLGLFSSKFRKAADEPARTISGPSDEPLFNSSPLGRDSTPRRGGIQ